MTHPTRLAALALPLALLLACSSGNTAGGTAFCRPGEVEYCRCDDGAEGTRRCGDDGRFRACYCPTIEPRVTCDPAAVEFGMMMVGSEKAFTIRCVDETRGSWPATAWVTNEFGGSAEVELDEPLPGSDDAWLLTGKLAAAEIGSIGARVHLGADEVALRTVQLRATSLADLQYPGWINYGLLVPGFQAGVKIELVNHGPVDAWVNRAYMAPESDDQFSVPWTEPIKIPAWTDEGPGEPVEIWVRLEPREERAGTRAEGTLLLSIRGETEPRGIPLTMDVGGPRLACTPDRLDFGTVGVGYPATLSVTCTNTGYDFPGRTADNLFGSGIDSDSAAFGVQFAGGFRPEGYAAGESFTFDVVFSPEREGQANGALELVTNGSMGVPYLIPLSGAGLPLAPCDFELRPASLDFGQVNPSGATLQFTIRNRGAGSCLLRELHLGDECHPAFSLRDGPLSEAIIGPGERLGVPVRFAPGATQGALSCEVRFDISNPTTPLVTVPLNGAGGEPCLVFDPPEVDFGQVVPMCISAPVMVTAENICSSPLQLGWGPFIPGPEAFDLYVWIDPITLEGGKSIAFPVSFAPREAGEVLGGLMLRSDDDLFLLPARGEGFGQSTGRDTFVQPARQKIDVLFVIDNGDMAGIRYALANSAESLLSHALGHDFQIGVTTAGITRAGSCPGGVSGGEDGRLFPVDNSRPRILSPTTPSLAQMLALNLDVGNCHYEHKILDAALRALTPPVIDNCDDPRHPEPSDGNCGFLRPGAALAIVAVTNAADRGAFPSSTYSESFKALGARPDLVRFHALTGDRGTGCNSVGGGGATPGDKLIDVADATGGWFHSVCTADWTATATALSRDIFRLESCFNLSRPASPSSIMVTVNGELVSPSTWTYHSDPGKVCFSELYLPEPGAQISISYITACQ